MSGANDPRPAMGPDPADALRKDAPMRDKRISTRFLDHLAGSARAQPP